MLRSIVAALHYNVAALRYILAALCNNGVALRYILVALCYILAAHCNNVVTLRCIIVPLCNSVAAHCNIVAAPRCNPEMNLSKCIIRLNIDYPPVLKVTLNIVRNPLVLRNDEYIIAIPFKFEITPKMKSHKNTTTRFQQPSEPQRK